MARRAAGFSPDSEAEVAREMTFLDESGDRAGARRVRKARTTSCGRVRRGASPETRASSTRSAPEPRLRQPTPVRPASVPSAATPVPAADGRLCPASADVAVLLVATGAAVAAAAYLAGISGHRTAAATPALR
jgi:hypothetical protein